MELLFLCIFLIRKNIIYLTFLFNIKMRMRLLQFLMGMYLEGNIKKNKMKLVQAWIEIHKDDLLADWELASHGEQVFKIEPLK